MKNTSRILALVLIVMTVLMSLSAFTVSAEDETSDGSVIIDIGNLEISSTTDGELVEGTGIYTTAGMAIEGNNKTVDGVKYTKRLKLPGTMKSDANYIKIEIGSPSKIVVIAISGNGSETRPLKLVDASFKDIASHDVPGDAAAKYEYSVEAAGTYYLGSGNKGINIYYIAVIPTCQHTGGEATCKDQAKCTLCGESYGPLSEEHNYGDDNICIVCGETDPNACAHANTTPAACETPEVCIDCGEELSPALNHTAGEAATCTTAQTCTVCGKELAKALGHTLTFVTTLPTAEATGKTIADCSACQEHFESGEVNVMTPGTYVLDPAVLAEYSAQGTFFDGEVKVVNGVFACHLSAKYRTDASGKTFPTDDHTSTHRMNFGGQSSLCNNGEGEQAVKNGGYKNFIQITTNGPTTVTIHWNAGGSGGREVAVYNMDGVIIKQTSNNPADNKALYVSTFTLPAGSYLLGNVVNQNYWHKVTVEVECAEHIPGAAATCTTAQTCTVCGEELAPATGVHYYVYNACYFCQAANPDFKYNFMVVGTNNVVCNQYHLVDTTGHGNPYQFTTFTVTEAGHYKFTSDKLVGLTLFTTEINSEGADFTAGTGASWAQYITGNEIDLQPGTYYIGIIFVEGEGEYEITLEKVVEEPTEPEQPTEQPELNFFQKIIAWFMELIQKILAIFKK